LFVSPDEDVSGSAAAELATPGLDIRSTVQLTSQMKTSPLLARRKHDPQPVMDIVSSTAVPAVTPVSAPDVDVPAPVNAYSAVLELAFLIPFCRVRYRLTISS